MVNEIHFLSVAQAQRLRPCRRSVVISILGAAERGFRPSLDGFRDVLWLEFMDTFEEAARARPGSWPREPTTLQHWRITECAQERAPSLSDALRIAAFVQQHHTASTGLRLIVHCFQGQSRSAAVARWASRVCQAPIRNERLKRDCAGNPRLLRLLDVAWKSHAAHA